MQFSHDAFHFTGMAVLVAISVVAHLVVSGEVQKWEWAMIEDRKSDKRQNVVACLYGCHCSASYVLSDSLTSYLILILLFTHKNGLSRL